MAACQKRMVWLPSKRRCIILVCLDTLAPFLKSAALLRRKRRVRTKQHALGLALRTILAVEPS